MGGTSKSGRNEFTISCNASDGVVITDGNGKKGGNVVSKQGSKISWKNVTDKACLLEFKRLLGDDSGTGAGMWPFKVTPQHPEPPDQRLAIGPGAKEERLLMNVAKAVYVEYQVVDAKGRPLRDPVIIIEQ